MTECYIPGAKRRDASGAMATVNYVSTGLDFMMGDGDAAILHPAGWLDAATPEERAAIGAVPMPTCDVEAQALERDPAAGWVLRDRTAEELAAATAAAKASALAEVDRQAEDARRRLLASGFGQALTYAEKEREARDVIGGGSGPWPLLSAEGRATGMAVSELALLVAAASDRWRDLAARIEAARRAAKLAVQGAGSARAVARTLTALRWPD